MTPAKQTPAPEPTRPNRLFQLVAVGLVVVSAVAGTGLARWLRETPDLKSGSTQPVKLQLNTWPKPDIALFMTAQMHGYLLPCGCSRPQIGGLERRYNLMQMLKEKGWSILPLDLGDVAQKEGPARLPNIQGLIKYRYAMHSMKMMGYSVTGLGEYEAALPTVPALAELLNPPASPTVLIGNIDPKSDPAQLKPQLTTWGLIEDPATKVKIAITAAIGSAAEARIKDTDLKLLSNADSLKALNGEMNKVNPDYRVLLYHGSLTRGQFQKGMKAEAVEVAKAFPMFNAILCLTEEDEPPANPTVVKHANGTETLLLGVGQKGKYVGILGLYRKGGAFDYKWEIVQLSEDFMTPPAKEAGHPVVEMMEKYSAELKKDKYLGKAPTIKHPSQVAIADKVPIYRGSEVCIKCHQHAHDVWKGTPHSEAYHTLEVEAKRPGNRQYDPECIVCHTVGYGYLSGFRDEETTPKLKDVGCESCHGPCSEHVRAPMNAAWYPVINPYRHVEGETADQEKVRLGRMDQFCQKCHDIDNDVTWSSVGFAAKWKKIIHRTPPAKD